MKQTIIEEFFPLTFINSIYIKKNNNGTPYIIIIWNEPKIQRFFLYLITNITANLKSDSCNTSQKYNYQMLITVDSVTKYAASDAVSGLEKELLNSHFSYTTKKFHKSNVNHFCKLLKKHIEAHLLNYLLEPDMLFDTSLINKGVEPVLVLEFTVCYPSECEI